MQEFIQMAMKSLGTDENTTRQATGGLLNLIQKNADAGDFNELLTKLPGADALAKDAPKPDAASGLAGAVSGMVGHLMGGDGGNAAGALGALAFLQKTGVDMLKIGPFVTMFLDFAKSKAGPDLISRILGKIPELQKAGA